MVLTSVRYKLENYRAFGRRSDLVGQFMPHIILLKSVAGVRVWILCIQPSVELLHHVTFK